MALIRSSVNRALDPDGTAIAMLRDSFTGQEIQAVALVDEQALQTGTPGSPLQTADAALLVQVQALREFAVNDVETAEDVMYIGKERQDGYWLLMKVTGSTTVRYASSLNNPTVTTYAEAWAARAALLFGYYSEAV